jgi:pimeloyl-ACP methyl ester carboxylesterase
MDRRTLARLSVASLITGLGSPSRAAAQRRITIRVRVPEGTGDVFLTGSLPELGPWNPAARKLDGAGRDRTTVLAVPDGVELEFKITRGGTWAHEALGPSGTVLPNFKVKADADQEVVVDVVDFRKDARAYIDDWRGSGVLGSLDYWLDVPSRFLAAKRHVEIWLPPGYDRAGAARYPVLYMHDGQNLFDPRIANTGIDWGVDEAVVRGVRAGAMPEVLVVGVWCTDDRLREYSPWHLGAAYARFLVEELKPRVDAAYRTRPGPEHTAVMGSSMGGLISFELCRRHPEVFGRGACLSTHFPFSDEMVRGEPPGRPAILRDVEFDAWYPREPRLWFDHGTEGLDAGYAPVQAEVTGWLQRQGRVLGQDFVVRRFEGATHNEAAWRARLDAPLAFLYA